VPCSLSSERRQAGKRKWKDRRSERGGSTAVTTSIFNSTHASPRTPSPLSAFRPPTFRPPVCLHCAPASARVCGIAKPPVRLPVSALTLSRAAPMNSDNSAFPRSQVAPGSALSVARTRDALRVDGMLTLARRFPAQTGLIRLDSLGLTRIRTDRRAILHRRLHPANRRSIRNPPSQSGKASFRRAVSTGSRSRARRRTQGPELAEGLAVVPVRRADLRNSQLQDSLGLGATRPPSPYRVPSSKITRITLIGFDSLGSSPSRAPAWPPLHPLTHSCCPHCATQSLGCRPFPPWSPLPPLPSKITRIALIHFDSLGSGQPPPMPFAIASPYPFTLSPLRRGPSQCVESALRFPLPEDSDGFTHTRPHLKNHSDRFDRV
jgi:hypothetical protein